MKMQINSVYIQRFLSYSFLICEYAKLEKIEVVDREKKKCSFVLQAEEELEPIVRDYFNDKLNVNPQKYKDKIISLKSLLHEKKNNRKNEPGGVNTNGRS